MVIFLYIMVNYLLFIFLSRSFSGLPLIHVFWNLEISILSWFNFSDQSWGWIYFWQLLNQHYRFKIQDLIHQQIFLSMQFSLILTIAKETYLPQTAAADTDISWGFCLRTINALEFMQPTSFFKYQPAFQRIFLIFLLQKLPNVWKILLTKSNYS